MKLIASLTSPFARKVRVVLHEKRIECQLEVDIPWDAETHVPDYNPLGKVPVLVFDDGHSLFDSRVIVEYLDSISPVSRLIPQDNRQAVNVKRWEALADGIEEAAANIFIEKKRPAALQSADWISRQQVKIDRGLKAMSDDLGERLWCSGDSYSLADIAVGCCLAYLDLRFAHIDWRAAYPNLERHFEKLSQRPSFAETVPPAS
ncbi:glutathione S-transferase [Parachitinimonas caeni]|uniref:Glutathione S-transferase n=1 Tax=Parachitinimonas caeni TaxID=3031301 RepID=A0ABT7DXF9_9NEIS|nr:glutathione S-transferase [Parachitinimonas caeni]MDK2124762.1 glutathione S-transferase [Parachitinimonas caeni]